MARPLNSSDQTRAVLAALIGDAMQWRYGYDISKETGLKSGSLYPILMRLAAQGWLDTDWQDAPDPGRPRRHLYRLSPDGAVGARALLEAQPQGRRLQLSPLSDAGRP